MLSEVEESIYGTGDDDQDDSAATQDHDDKPIVKRSEMLFVRGKLLVQQKGRSYCCTHWSRVFSGDSVVLISPFNS